MWSNPQFSADLVTFTEEIPNRKLHFLCSGNGLRIFERYKFWKCKALWDIGPDPTILVIIFWDILMLDKIFVSPQVKLIVIISNKHGIFEFASRAAERLNFRALGN